MRVASLTRLPLSRRVNTFGGLGLSRMVSGTPKNNLEEVLQRKQSAWHAQNTSNGTPAAAAKGKLSKFKPAAPVPVLTSSTNITLGKPRAFSTAGFKQTGSLPQIPSNSASSSTPKLEVICVSSDSSTSSSPSPLVRSAPKRTSSDLGSTHELSPRSKRLKKASERDGAGIPSSPKKVASKKFKPVQTQQDTNGRALMQHETWNSTTPNTESEVNDTTNKHRDPPQIISKTTTPNSLTSAPAPRSLVPQQLSAGLGGAGNTQGNSPSKHLDLFSESQESLVAMLKGNEALHTVLGSDILNHHTGLKVVDVHLFEQIRDVLNNRMKAISDVLRMSRPSHRPESIPNTPRLNSPSPAFLPTVQQSSHVSSTTYDYTVLSGSGASTNTLRQFETDLSAGNDPTDVFVIEDEDEDDYWAEVPDIAYDDDDVNEFPFTILSQSTTTYGQSPAPAPATDTVLQTPAANLTQSRYYKEIEQQLKTVFHLEHFRPNQLEAITAAMEGKDVFVLMPTGGGKSLCYQLPAVCDSGATSGVTVVVSPLLALMKDQVDALRAKNIDVFLWNGDTALDDVSARLNSDTRPKLMYVTPEKLKESAQTKRYMSMLYNQNQLARFVIDEAHCISTWGQDFREAYQGLDFLRQIYPKTPIMALTATANQVTIDDITRQLRMREDYKFFQQSFNRANLRYVIRPKAKTIQTDLEQFIQKNHHRKSGVIYCTSRKRVEEVAGKLIKNGFSAHHFHAGMMATEKARVLEAWREDKIHIIVATIAFGMGIDKANVRFVIHHDLPKSIDGYYQETGRAGRDGLPADCLLFYGYQDFRTILTMITRPQEGKERSAPDVIARQEEAARKVVEYCCNTVDCRREVLLEYFGEVFDKVLCRQGCDNCSNDTACLTQNVTDEARHALELVRTLTEENRESVSMAQARAVLKGAKTQDVFNKGHDRLSMYGKAAGLSPELTEAMWSRLVRLKYLAEKSIPTNTGWHTNILSLGPKAPLFLGDRTKLMVQYRPKSKGAGKVSVPRARRGAPMWARGRVRARGEIVEDGIEVDDDTFTFGSQ